MTDLWVLVHECNNEDLQNKCLYIALWSEQTATLHDSYKKTRIQPKFNIEENNKNINNYVPHDHHWVLITWCDPITQQHKLSSNTTLVPLS